MSASPMRRLAGVPDLAGQAADGSRPSPASRAHATGPAPGHAACLAAVSRAGSAPGASRPARTRFLPAPLAAACLAVLLLAAPQAARRVHAQAAGLGASVELVDPKVFRACADPHNLPFSDERAEGFENKIAALLAAKLGKPVAYTFYPQTVGFVRNTLNAFRCDVVLGTAQGDDLVQTTNPYYRTTYVLVTRAGSDLDGVDSLEDPKLQGRKLGIIAGTPPSILLVRANLMQLAKPYPLTVDTRYEQPAKTMVDDLAAGTIDAGVLWGPLGGYWARQSSQKLTVTPLLKEHGIRLDYAISLGVRHSDQDWKRSLNRLLAENQDEINAILAGYGVPLLDNQGHLITAAK